jgi:hypothetical protein
MQTIRRALLAVFTVLATALPASAQTATAPDTSLGLVWGWILVAGVIIFGVGTCLGVGSGKK